MFLKVSCKVQAAKNIIPLMRSTNFQKNLYKLLGDDENHNSSFMSFVQVVPSALGVDHRDTKIIFPQ